MKTKIFSFIIIFVYFIAVCMLVGINTIAEKQWGLGLQYDWRTGKIWGGDGIWVAENKTNYIARNNGRYDSFIIGGSKAGSIHTSRLNDLTNCTFYNYWTNWGCFYNYEMYINYILKNNNVKHIVLCLSGTEVYHIDPPNKVIPSKIKSTPFASEITELTNFKKKYLNINTFLDLYKNRKKPKSLEVLTYSDGSRDFSNYKTKMKENPSDYVIEKVFSFFGGFDKNLMTMFTTKQKLSACDYNIKSLNRIVSMLKKKEVLLTIIIMPQFIGEQFYYITPEYDDYLRNMTEFVDVWNFGGINEINMNPYNFSDGGHSFDFVADDIIEEVFSIEPNTTDMNAFGILLTKENIDSYILNQKQKFLMLKNEYDITGTVKLLEMGDKSYLGE